MNCVILLCMLPSISDLNCLIVQIQEGNERNNLMNVNFMTIADIMDESSATATRSNEASTDEFELNISGINYTNDTIPNINETDAIYQRGKSLEYE